MKKKNEKIKVVSDKNEIIKVISKKKKIKFSKLFIQQLKELSEKLLDYYIEESILRPSVILNNISFYILFFNDRLKLEKINLLKI